MQSLDVKELLKTHYYMLTLKSLFSCFCCTEILFVSDYDVQKEEKKCEISGNVVETKETILVQPHFKCCVLFWEPQQKEDKKVLESVQRRAMKMMNGLEGKLCKEWLRSLDFLSLEKSLRGGLIVVYSFLRRGSEEAGTDLSDDP